MKKFLKVETKYNENLADAQVLVVTLLSNINRTWDFIVDVDAYHTLQFGEDYLVTTQDDWLGTIVGIRFETVANAINLKATVLKPVPVYDDQVEVLDETEDDTEEDHQLVADELGVGHVKSVSFRDIDLQSSINDLLVLKRFAEDKLVELRCLTAKGVDTYSKFYDNNTHFPLRNPYDDMLRVVLYKGNKDKNKK